MNNVFSIGNKKIGKDTLIFNMTPAKTCPARKVCYVRDKCYALKAERLYPSVMPYRIRQRRYWRECTAINFVNRVKKIRKKKRRKIKYLRFNESGDFRNQKDVNKAIKIATLLKPLGITTYMYTARKDLDYSKRRSLVITGSNFMVDNNFKIMSEKELSKHKYKCKGNCRYCNLCKTKKRRVIGIKLH